MSDYNLRALNDKEFEAFCADLIGEYRSERFERFKSGRDQGVDARFFKTDATEVILQCKHRPHASFSALLRHLREEEKPKVDRLQPSHYILCLSHSLSRADKRKLAEVMSPHVRQDSDIFGAEDLNDLLDKHRTVAHRHHKLWLSSARVLTLIVEKPIFSRSAFTLDEALETAKTYVTTSSYNEAIRRLEDLGVLIISGEPGAGKTSLAEHAALRYVADGYEFYKIADDIREAEAVFSPGTRQLFYFDDFLGRNYLEALSGHEGNLITHFIRRVRRDTAKRFILTSRTTILNQGKTLIDSFEHQNLKRHEFELNVSLYSNMDRALILYSHLWHSTLTTDYIDQIYDSKRYRDIIEHRHFNPRLITFVTDAERVADREPSEYWDFINETLNDPAKIWEHPYVAQLDDAGRALVLLVALNGGDIPESELAAAYHRFVALPENRPLSGPRDFIATLRHLTRSFFNRVLGPRGSSAATIALFNPSIADYIFKRFARDTTSLRLGFVSLETSSSLKVLAGLDRNKLIGLPAVTDILRSILETARRSEFARYSTEYICSALSAYVDRVGVGEHRSPVVLEATRHIMGAEIAQPLLNMAHVFELGLINEIIPAGVGIRFLHGALELDPDTDELFQLVRLVEAIPQSTLGYQHAARALENAILGYVRVHLDRLVSEDEIFTWADPEDDEEVLARIWELVVTAVEEFGITCSTEAARSIADAYDLVRHRENFFNERAPRSRRSTTLKRRGSGTTDEIDDLFDRQGG